MPVNDVVAVRLSASNAMWRDVAIEHNTLSVKDIGQSVLSATTN